MTSDRRAGDLLWFTREILGEMRRHRDRGVWNGVVRRGQEIVGNSLKAVMLNLGAEYPKAHDPAPALERLIADRHLPVDPARLARLRRASKELAELRAPAGYMEIRCTEEQAHRAAEAAEDAFRFAVELCGEPPAAPAGSAEPA